MTRTHSGFDSSNCPKVQCICKILLKAATTKSLDLETVFALVEICVIRPFHLFNRHFRQDHNLQNARAFTATYNPQTDICMWYDACCIHVDCVSWKIIIFIPGVYNHTNNHISFNLYIIQYLIITHSFSLLLSSLLLKLNRSFAQPCTRSLASRKSECQIIRTLTHIYHLWYVVGDTTTQYYDMCARIWPQGNIFLSHFIHVQTFF